MQLCIPSAEFYYTLHCMDFCIQILIYKFNYTNSIRYIQLYKFNYANLTMQILWNNHAFHCANFSISSNLCMLSCKFIMKNLLYDLEFYYANLIVCTIVQLIVLIIMRILLCILSYGFFRHFIDILLFGLYCTKFMIETLLWKLLCRLLYRLYHVDSIM